MCDILIKQSETHEAEHVRNFFNTNLLDIKSKKMVNVFVYCSLPSKIHTLTSSVICNEMQLCLMRGPLPAQSTRTLAAGMATTYSTLIFPLIVQKKVHYGHHYGPVATCKPPFKRQNNPQVKNDVMFPAICR